MCLSLGVLKLVFFIWNVSFNMVQYVYTADTLIFIDVYEFNLLNFNLNVWTLLSFSIASTVFVVSLLLLLLSQLDPEPDGIEQKANERTFVWMCVCVCGNMLFTFYRGSVIKVGTTPWWFNKMLKQHVQRQQTPWQNDIKLCSARFFLFNLSVCAQYFCCCYSFSLTNFRFWIFKFASVLIFVDTFFSSSSAYQNTQNIWDEFFFPCLCLFFKWKHIAIVVVTKKAILKYGKW